MLRLITIFVTIFTFTNAILESTIQTLYQQSQCFYILVDETLVTDVLKSVNRIKIPCVVHNSSDIKESRIFPCENIHVKIIITTEKTLENILMKNTIDTIFRSRSIILTLVSTYNITHFKEVFKEIIFKYFIQVVQVLNYNTSDDNSTIIYWMNQNKEFKNPTDFKMDYILHKKNAVFWSNVTLHASAFNCSPFFMFDGTKYDGLEYQMLNEILKNFNVKYTFHDRLNVSDTWEAVLQDVLKGRSDIGLCSQWLTIYMYELKTYTTPYSQICATFLVPKPTEISPMLFIFLPLSLKTWICILVVTICLIFALNFLAIQFSKLFSNFHSRYVKISECFDHILRILIQQSTSYFPPNIQNVIRCLILIWILGTLLITTGYSAGITSLLTKPRFSEPINTFTDFIAAKLKWGMRTNLYAKFLTETNDQTMIKIGQSFETENSDEIKNARLRTNHYATLVKTISNIFVTDIEFMDEDVKHILRTMQECIGNYYLVFILRKNSPLKEIFDRKLYQIIEGGLHHFWFNDILNNLHISFMKRFFVDSGTELSKNKPLNFDKLEGVYIFLAISLSIAFMVFLIELIKR